MTELTLRFANSAPPPGVSEGDLWVVLDPAWTESVGGRRDAVVGLRSLAAAVLERQDLFPRTSELLDTWQEASGIARAFALGGTSYWFRRRLTVWRWLHERLIWLAILDELASRKPFGAIELRPSAVDQGGFILPADQIQPTWEENRPAAFYLIEQLLMAGPAVG